MPEERWTWDETLYAGSASFYLMGRMPYPAAVAETLRRELGLDGTQRLLDVRCAPGSLTLLLAPIVSVAVGVDANREMLREAQRESERAGVSNVSWRHMRAEALPADLGRFDLVTFAQSFHCMDRLAVARTVRAMLPPDGACVHVSKPLRTEVTPATIRCPAHGHRTTRSPSSPPAIWDRSARQAEDHCRPERRPTRATSCARLAFTGSTGLRYPPGTSSLAARTRSSPRRSCFRARLPTSSVLTALGLNAICASSCTTLHRRTCLLSAPDRSLSTSGARTPDAPIRLPIGDRDVRAFEDHVPICVLQTHGA